MGERAPQRGRTRSRNPIPLSQTVGRGPRTHGEGRVCAFKRCDTKLSRYNPEEHCSIHGSRARQYGADPGKPKPINMKGPRPGASI